MVNGGEKMAEEGNTLSNDARIPRPLQGRGWIASWVIPLWIVIYWVSFAMIIDFNIFLYGYL